MKENELKFFIPIKPTGGTKSQSRQKFISKVKEFLECKKVPEAYLDKSFKLKATVNFYYQYETGLNDIDNSLKALFDGMKDSVFVDDRQIREVHATIITSMPLTGVGVVLEEFNELSK